MEVLRDIVSRPHCGFQLMLGLIPGCYSRCYFGGLLSTECAQKTQRVRRDLIDGFSRASEPDIIIKSRLLAQIIPMTCFCYCLSDVFKCCCLSPFLISI